MEQWLCDGLCSTCREFDTIMEQIFVWNAIVV